MQPSRQTKKNMETQRTSVYDTQYHTFKIAKGNGRFRFITAPCEELKTRQSVFLDRVLYTKMPHKCAHGFVPGRSIVTNAQKHVSKRIVLNIDIRDFFPSVTSDMVRDVLVNHYGFKGEMLDDATNMLTYKGALPQGAPTSPHVANMALYEFDKWVDRVCSPFGLSYTRYADDLTFSGEYIPQGFVSLLRKKLKSIGFAVAEDKVHLNGRDKRQMVTGLVVNEKVSLPRSVRRWLRAVLHSGKSAGAENMLNKSDKTLEQIQGYIGLQSLLDHDTFVQQLSELNTIIAGGK